MAQTNLSQFPSITITQNSQVIAHHTTDSPLSHYGQPVWVIEQDPDLPGEIHWSQKGGGECRLQALELRGGWLVCRQPGGFLVGIIWSDGTYYAELLEDRAGRPIKRLTRRAGLRVRGTVQLEPENPDDLGGILAGGL
ncbi:MAG: hypothetical protein ACE15E_00565 [Acidobacteriota bacterium]